MPDLKVGGSAGGYMNEILGGYKLHFEEVKGKDKPKVPHIFSSSRTRLLDLIRNRLVK